MAFMEWIDTHTHLFDKAFTADLSLVVDSCLAASVKQCYLPNISAATLLPMEACVRAYPYYFFPLYGLHPSYVGSDYKEQLQQINAARKKTAHVGIGEIGLDFYHDTTFKKEQYLVLEEQLEWAMAEDLPLSLHARGEGALTALLQVLSNYSKLKGVCHCFSGDMRQAEVLIKSGFYLGIGGIVTYRNDTTSALVAQIPLSSLVLETDAPYLTPSPYRGKRNSPAYLPIIGAKIAEIKSISLQEVASVTTINALKVFHKQVVPFSFDAREVFN